MKKFNVLLVALALLIGTLFSNAAVTVPVVKTTTSIQLEDLLKNPHFTIEADAFCNFTFLINSEGEIVVLSVDTDDHTIEKFIKKRLNHKKLNSSLERGKVYQVPVRITS